MGRILHPLFALLASVTRQDLARQVAYLKEDNRILRARLPERLVATDPHEHGGVGGLIRYGLPGTDLAVLRKQSTHPDTLAE